MGLVGIVLAGASSFFDGSWACPFKLVKSPPHAALWQLAVCFGVLVTGIVAGMVLQVSFDKPLMFDVVGAWGGGALIAGSFMFSFPAITRLGLAFAQGLWCGTAVLTSFLWGMLVLHNRFVDTGGGGSMAWLAILGVVVLVLGVVGIVFSTQLGAMWVSRPRDGPLLASGSSSAESSAGEVGDAEAGLRRRRRSESGEAAYSPLAGGESINASDEAARAEGEGGSDFFAGVFLAILTGFCAGTSLVPMSFLPDDVPGLRALPSFGLGAFVASFVPLGIAVLREGWGNIWNPQPPLADADADADADETGVAGMAIKKGMVVEYQTRSGVDEWEMATVAVVGHDDELTPYYQIQIADGQGATREKQTVPERLRIPMSTSRQVGPGTSWCALGVAVGCGALFNVGNALTVLAIEDVGYAVGFSIHQTSVFFAGLWGIFAFGELNAPGARQVFAISAVVMVSGAAAIAVSVDNCR